MLSLAVVAVLASSGAASAQEVTNPLYPLKVGAVWTYKVSGGTIQVKVEKTEKIGNDECYKLETSAQGKVAATEDVVVKSDGVYRTAVNGLRPDAAVCFLNTKETSWKVNTKVQGQEVTGEFTKKEEDVTVPAGVYKGATLVESKDFKIGGMETSIKMWFVKDIGIVKLEFKLGGQDASLELDKYEAPK
jgi:opacity protein-like surface antigen